MKLMALPHKKRRCFERMWDIMKKQPLVWLPENIFIQFGRRGRTRKNYGKVEELEELPTLSNLVLK